MSLLVVSCRVLSCLVLSCLVLCRTVGLVFGFVLACLILSWLGFDLLWLYLWFLLCLACLGLVLNLYVCLVFVFGQTLPSCNWTERGNMSHSVYTHQCHHYLIYSSMSLLSLKIALDNLHIDGENRRSVYLVVSWLFLIVVLSVSCLCLAVVLDLVLSSVSCRGFLYVLLLLCLSCRCLWLVFV